MIAGLDWLASAAKLPAVASMSLGAGTPNAVLEAATATILGLGVTVVTAAGNFNSGAVQAKLCCMPRRRLLHVQTPATLVLPPLGLPLSAILHRT